MRAYAKATNVLRTRVVLAEVPQQEPDDAGNYVFGVAGSSFELDGVRLPGKKSAPAGGWWAKLVLERGTAAFGDSMSLEARVSAALEDSRPIVAVFAENNVVVDMFERLLTVKDVRLTTDLELGRGIELRDLHIEGRKLLVLGTVRFEEGGKQGILYAKHGRLSIGVELAGEKRDWKLLGAREWFERRQREHAGATP